MDSNFNRQRSSQQETNPKTDISSPPNANPIVSDVTQVPKLTLPKGGGALKGIDEKFTVNAVNGTNAMSVPLPVAPARGGFSPSLLLGYSSGFGNSLFGLGWTVGVPSIKRKTERELPRYQDGVESDTFILSDAEDLIPLLKKDEVTDEWELVTRETTDYRIKQYRPRIEGLWARIEQWQKKDGGEIHWRTISPNNVTSFYGPDEDSRLADPADKTGRIFEWRLSHTFDDKGNLIVYRYKPEDFAGVPKTIFEKNRDASNCTNLYLKKVLYGNKTSYNQGDPLPPESDFLFETVFDYGEHDATRPLPDDNGTWDTRPDPFSFFRAGFDIRTYRLCKRVLLFHKFDELPVKPYLVSALELGYEDFPGNLPTEDNLEGFTYLKQVTQRGYLYDAGADEYTSKTLPPLNYYYQAHEWNTEVKQLSTEDVYNAPIGIDFDSYRWIDLYSEGLSGILSEKADGWYYKRNLGHGDFTPALLVSPKPSFSGVTSGALQIQDLAGVGDTYLVNWAQEPKGFFHFTDDEVWQSFQWFETLPNRDLLSDPQVRFIDLNGDGLADLLISEDEFFAWHESKGEQGFGPANFIEMPLDDEQGPRLVFSDPEQVIFLADMSGDGLADLVRIRNGEVCYWANLGYGRFSMKITMENAPHFDHTEEFNPAFIRLTDIDGSGTTDLIYLGRNDFRTWLNLSGNSWTEESKIISFPAIDNLADVSVLDLLGTGTASLVWSSPLPTDSNAPLRYIDLMNSRKPHLLDFYENNMGREVAFDYLPSTHFYLDDQKRGQSWATKLPFPVHVVTKVTVEDKIRETIFTSTYSYHHGYFDSTEREFRGFGRVEQLDTEEFSTFSLNTAQNVVEEEHHQPPVRTVTWFHTGAALQKKQLAETYKEEYYQNIVVSEIQLLASTIPEGLNSQEWGEALRACKGLMLRREVYAEDSTDKQPHPYSTAQSSYEIRLVQPLAGHKHACFQVVSKEAIVYTYDRNPADPRRTHSLTLETDDKGFITKSASVIYPRVQRPAGLPDAVWDEQNKRHIVYTEIDYTDDIDTDDIYRLRASYENRAYELLGAPLPAGQFLTKANLLTFTQTAATIPFEDDGDGSLQKRLFSHSRLYFLRNDLNGGLPLGQRESLGLVHRTMHLAYTAGLVGRHYTGKVTPAMLTQAGYEHSEGDSDWWISSGINLYPVNAANRFYIPEGFRDALGSETHITFDPYILLPETSTDAIGNTVTVQNDYRTLSPHLITDANLNRSAVETDELGLVIKSAVMGKMGTNEGDTLADPTARMEYDFFNWLNHGQPNFAHTFAREQHGPGNPRWQESYVYSDGGGSVIMSKIQAEPGRAKRWNSDTGQIEEIETSNRWVGNGRTILNNKGNPIKQYEPYFSTTHEYEHEPELVETGVTPIIYYDSIGRNIRTELPNGTFSKVEFDPWHSTAFDLNDTVRDSQWYSDRGSPDPLTDPEPSNPEQRAAWLAAKHHDTPATIHTDSLGRIVYAVADYGNGKTTAVRNERDLTGRYVRIFDQLDREVSLSYTNLVGMSIYGQSAEKGEQWIFQNILGRMVKTWDNNLREFWTTYDALHRPLSAFVSEGGNEFLFSHIVYGENHPNAQDLNLRGLAYQVYDQAGVMTIKQVDFKGNPLEVERRLAQDYKQIINWQTLEGLTDIIAIDSAANPLLETETFSGTSVFDALNRPMEVTLPDDTVIRPRYNEANYLDSLEAQIRGQGGFITFLENQNYNARGQREWAKYGNDAVTKFFYDPATFRLTNLLTTKQESDPPTTSLQNLKYTYDPVGNITQLIDEAQQTHFFQNSVVRPEHKYEYDALYQLIKASGREHAGLGGNAQRNHLDIPFIAQLPHPNNATAVRMYTETYEYDDLGNILVMSHQAGGVGSWTRRYRYAYQDDSTDRTNRLAATSLPGDPAAGPYSATYSHDLHGNMTHMPHLNELVWNYMDQLKEVDLGGGGRAYYVYGVGGQRMRKVIERNGSTRIEHIYLSVVEIRRERSGNNALHLERWTTHISDDSGRIAQVDTKTIDTQNSDPVNPLNVPLIRYQYTNHLGSAVLETNEVGDVISYEEYHPYGTTAYHSSQSVVDLSLKRYRFSGKEKDNETGFYYFGARYYTAWLGRWTSSDLGGFIDGFNMFKFVSNNPINVIDASGMSGERSFTIPEELRGITDPTEFSRGLRQRGFDFTGVDEAGRPVEPNAEGRGVGLARLTDRGWNVGIWLRIPGEGTEDGGGTGEDDGGETASQPDASGGDETVAPSIPPRPAIQPGVVPDSPNPPRPIPRVDLPQARPGTNFAAEESAARRSYRASNTMQPGEQVQHWYKWRRGRATNLDPRITNDRRNLSPIQSRNALSNRTYTVNGRTYRNPHTYADRGLYPTYERRYRRRYGNWATERTTHAMAARRTRLQVEGTRGPRPPYMIMPTVVGAGGNLVLGATRNLVPFVAEAEIGFATASIYAYGHGYATAGLVLESAAAYTPIVAGSAVAGGIAGHAADNFFTEATGSEEAGLAAGVIASAATGAAVGALIGTVVPIAGNVVGAGVGAAVGAVAGLGAYLITKYW